MIKNYILKPAKLFYLLIYKQNGNKLFFLEDMYMRDRDYQFFIFVY